MTKRPMTRVIAAAGVMVAVFLPVSAGAQAANYPGSAPPQVLGQEISRTLPQVPGESSRNVPQVLGQTASRGGDELPVTGGDVAGLAALGLGAIATGTVLVRRSRVRRT